jgi:sn-glycerol 3-phosphate transport system substrate-binding protein
VQVYDIGQAYMRDSGQVVPMQAFIDRDKFATADFEPAVINYYKYQDKLQSMPFNSSSSMLYYNKDAFKEVGLDPNKPPVTFTEVAEAAKKLTKKDASGATTRYGFGPSVYGWLFEQLLATSGALYADNGNGRDNRATKVEWNSAAGKAILDWWKAGVDGGYFFNPGIDNDGAANAFNAQKTAMYIESTARLRGHINTVAGKFEIGTGLYPRPDSKPATGGNIIGGASLYIMKNRPPAEQQAAWEFVKYAMTPAVQGQWQADTGYYPIVKAAYDTGPSKEWATKYPQFLTAVNQIRESPQNRATNGAVLGVMPQARQRTQKMIESVLGGQAPQAALEAAVADMNSAIDKYNKANP